MAQHHASPLEYADAEPEDVAAFQQAVGQWAEQTFPQSTANSIVAHLDDELTELTKAIVHEPHMPKGRIAIMDEAADCYLLLLHLAHKRGFSLQEVAATKFIRNTRRQWGTPDARGVVKHVGVES